MVVSIPEKTLEHWASIYLTYRYRSLASLWWPARGEDINVGALPGKPGKAVQLELKTTSLNPKGDIHEVKIDLRQLENYLLRPHGLRPFYVFPKPHWKGTLDQAAAADLVPATEVGFSRSEAVSLKPWWFANWLAVLTTDKLAQILQADLAAFQAGGVRYVPLTRFDFSSGHRVQTWRDGKPHLTIPWRAFWTQLEACGQASWPQLIQVPASFLGKRRLVDHADLRLILAEASGFDGELIAMASNGEGIYGPLADRSPARTDRTGDDGEEADVHRILAFLDVDALDLA